MAIFFTTLPSTRRLDAPQQLCSMVENQWNRWTIDFKVTAFTNQHSIMSFWNHRETKCRNSSETLRKACFSHLHDTDDTMTKKQGQIQNKTKIYCLLLNPKLTKQHFFSPKTTQQKISPCQIEKLLTDSQYVKRKVGTNFNQISHWIRLRPIVPIKKVQSPRKLLSRPFTE